MQQQLSAGCGYGGLASSTSAAARSLLVATTDLPTRTEGAGVHFDPWDWHGQWHEVGVSEVSREPQTWGSLLRAAVRRLVALSSSGASQAKFATS